MLDGCNATQFTHNERMLQLYHTISCFQAPQLPIWLKILALLFLTVSDYWYVIDEDLLLSVSSNAQRQKADSKSLKHQNFENQQENV